MRNIFSKPSPVDQMERELRDAVRQDLPSGRPLLQGQIIHQRKVVAHCDQTRKAVLDKLRQVKAEHDFLMGELKVIDAHKEAALKSIAEMEQIG